MLWLDTFNLIQKVSNKEHLFSTLLGDSKEGNYE